MQKLAELRKTRGLTQQQLASVLNIDRTSIGKYEKHDVVPSKDVLLKLANFFSVSTDFLLGAQSSTDNAQEILIKHQHLINLYESANMQAKKSALSVLELGQGEKATRQLGLECMAAEMREPPHTFVPVVGRAAAGVPIEMVEDYDDPLEMDDPKLQPGDFAVIAAGDSMIDAGISDGDRVIFRPCPDVDNGTIALVAIDNGSTIKYFYKTETGFKLKPANKAYAPLLFDKKADVRILGRFVKVAGQ